MTNGAALQESAPAYPGWKVVAAAAAALAFGPSTIAVLSLGLFMRSFEAEFGWARTQVALATTIVSYVIVVVSPLQGWLADRFGARRLILASIPAFGLGIMALSLLPPVLWIYYLAWIVIPFLGVGLFPLAYLKVVSGWFSQRLGLALGFANSGVAIGALVIPLLVGFLIDARGWRFAYVGLGLIVLLVTWPLAWAAVRERSTDSPAAVAHTPIQTSMTFAAALRTREFVLLSAAYLLVGTATTALIVHQVPLLIDGGMAPSMAVWVQTVFGLFGLIGRLACGLLLDHVRAPRVMIGFILGGIVTCTLYAAGAGGATAFVCSALLGLLFGAEFDVLAYMVKNYFGLVSFGRIYGVIFAMFQFGAGFGAALLPMARDRFGSYSAGLVVFVGLLVLSAVIFALVRDPQRIGKIAHAPA